MYSTCLVCNADLGTNEAIEHFPVGSRLAFDAAKGLLWVVCRKCERWNLTPLEERWEAIEECERAYRDARTRVSTDNIGLAQLADGTEIVRIGKPLKPELAAWRYGDQFGRRRKRALVSGGIAAAAVAGGAAALPALGFPAAAIALLGLSLLPPAAILGATQISGAVLMRARWLRDAEGQWLLVTGNDMENFRLMPGGDTHGWELRLGYRDRRDTPTPRLKDILNLPSTGEAHLTGEAGLDAARQLMPIVNGRGASRAVVGDAVRTLADTGGGEDAFRGTATRIREYAARQVIGDTGSIRALPRPVRLALEMAAFEDQERLALEGELAGLERAWREADELAHIADRLLEPPSVAGALERIKVKVADTARRNR
jgi:hypothetical protein